jgi:hypothetical protein
VKAALVASNSLVWGIVAWAVATGV